ncbi:ABC transporter ATP-binding protein [Sulfodiicoccus acidiphilus]|nr:ABC transporter ATP-binding protein [Sulfodiicoccus acidiphilus]
MASVMSVKNLVAGYYTPTGVIVTVTGVSFDVNEGEIFAIVGESGCGKSTLAAAIYRLLKPPGKVFHGKVLFHGRDLLELNEEEVRKIRGKEISYVPQYAMDALDPVSKIGKLMKRFLEEHDYNEGEAEREVVEKLKMMRLPEQVVNMYPMELSGGMRQRVVLATSMLLNPRLVILDEPTTGLDVLVQYGILKDLKQVQRQLGFSVIIISHDLPMIMMLADRVSVMYAGELVEVGARDQLLENPKHPYTSLLLRSVPSIMKRRDKLLTIPGSPPLLTSLPKACRFSPRCPFKVDACEEGHPVLAGNSHTWRCFVTQDGRDVNSLSLPIDYFGGEEVTEGKTGTASEGDVVMEVRNLTKVFRVGRGLISKEDLVAVNNVSFTLRRNLITALVGGSGHGKSTIARILAGIERQTSGEVFVKGKDYSSFSSRNTREYRSEVQMIFQDPYSSLDPRHTVKWHIERPLRLHGKVKNDEELESKVREILNVVGLRPAERYVGKLPHQLSGGERQRTAVARALAVEPEVLIADEPVSMLDASVRAGVLNLLKKLKGFGMSILYITHDLATVSYVADEMMVIHNGQIVERGEVWQVINSPSHEYTKALIEAVPDPYKRL